MESNGAWGYEHACFHPIKGCLCLFKEAIHDAFAEFFVVVFVHFENLFKGIHVDLVTEGRPFDGLIETVNALTRKSLVMGRLAQLGGRNLLENML